MQQLPKGVQTFIMAALSQPTAMVVNTELFDYLKEVLSIVFDILSKKEETELDKAALSALSVLKEQLEKSKETQGGIPFLTGLSTREFAVLKQQMSPGKYLHEYTEKFQIAACDQDVKADFVTFQGVVDSAESMFRIGKWVGMIHQMNISSFGENYKIDAVFDFKSDN